MNTHRISLRALFILPLALSLVSCNRAPVAEAPPESSTSQAQPPLAATSTPKKPSDLDSVIADRFLKRFPATYDYDEVLGDELVGTLLRELLGTEYGHLKDNLSVLRTPIDVVSGNLALYGVRNDFATREEAVLCISFHPLRVHVGIISNYATTIYSRTPRYEHLPRCIHQWVFMQRHDGIDQPPAQGDGEATFTFKVVPEKATATPSAGASSNTGRQAGLESSGPSSPTR